MKASTLRVVVLSSLFPSRVQPTAGVFIRERMFRVAQSAPIVVVAPQPWFPFQGLIRLLRPGYRLSPSGRETQDGIDVYFPRFLSIPGLGRRLDGLSMAIRCLPLLIGLRKRFAFSLIDAHFAYPNGYAAILLGRWLAVAVTLTLRGTEPGHLQRRPLAKRVRAAVQGATQVIAVSSSLRSVALDAGADPERTDVVGNGVDLCRFSPMPRDQARVELGLPQDAKILVSVGGLVERKGFHRVIDAMPSLLERFPKLVYLVVGGPSVEGDMTEALETQVRRLRLGEHVRFLGPITHERIRVPLSAADVFVLATRNEGWANVILEAMACGLPVITTNVGGNAEVVNSEELGTIVPFGDTGALAAALETALEREWDRSAIQRYAHANSWNHRIPQLVALLERAAGRATKTES